MTTVIRFFNRRAVLPYVFVSPLVLLLLLINVVPVFYSLYLSLSHWPLERIRELPTFAGLANYQRMFEDSRLMGSAKFTALFTFASVPIEISLGLILALLLDGRFPGRAIVRALFVLPLAMAPLVTGLVWRYLFSREYGLVNYLLSFMQIAPVSWLSATPWAQISIIITEVWLQMPFASLVFLAGLQAIPNELVETARLDGAGRIAILRHITLPLLRPALLVVGLITSTNAVRSFELSYALTSGGPFQSTETFSFLAYQVGFRFFDLPYAAAISWTILAINLAISLLFMRLMYREQEP